jgi:plasmid replication initiation protein
MSIYLKRKIVSQEFTRLLTAFHGVEGAAAKPHKSIRIEGMVGHLDPLTEIQQKVLTAVISLANGTLELYRTDYMLGVEQFITLCACDRDNPYESLLNETGKLLKKGIWMFDESKQTVVRTTWFQSIEFVGGKVVFQFAEKALPLIFRLASDNPDYDLVKGIQYKGKHTLAVFSMVWPYRSKGVIEYSIPHLMQQLSLEHTRYSYGQLKLRILEPAFKEIYTRDEAIFVQFGPTFSGRKVEGVWFEVTVGERARELRRLAPEFRIAHPEQKPASLL